VAFTYDSVLFKILFVYYMNKFMLEHYMFLYESSVKCNTTRKDQKKFRRKFLSRNTIYNLVSKVKNKWHANRQETIS
jgi:hypothetical protein